ncbi:Flp pilus assembly protein ATPase [Caenibius tardaugens NBRC 16725]|uniref:Flp pilus assembly protein ATPase n=1 Tax=Caenibius tardaugens NBRC 16725 TaxID=1219035 RepID=U3A3U9_9SPHN|nr:Flp pilus assembly protein ATPase [Caenibius tardaugens]AZI36756.1 pilus assembly protein CpaE [Caenibius tardaugens NBRC 16725]GAD49428.1 Flp pilus assembly protein ATPase [Caenibius tardaugens NBRC 16725]
MNAPWKPGMAGNRDPFSAFVCDDATLDQLRPVIIEMGWQPEKCNRGGLRNAVQSLSVSASPAILLVDLSECGDPLNDINGLAEVCEPGTVVIAIGQVNDVRLYRDLLASGIHDYLLKPLSASQLRDSLTHAQMVFAAPKGGDGTAAKRHISTAIVGARGGVGASTLATSLSWLFSMDHKLPTALLDLDVHFGTGALTLDLEPGRGLTDAIDNPSRIDGLFIERAMIRANDNLAILSAEAPISAPLMTDGAAFIQLEEEFRQAFDMTVIDMPRNMLINFPHLLGNVNIVVITAELTLASARDTIRILAWLKSNAPHTHLMVVANKVQPGTAEITKADFEASIERRIDFLVPFDLKAAANAAKLGQTFIAANPSSKASAIVRNVAQAIIHSDIEPDESGESTASKSKSSLLGKIDLKGLIAKKEKANA